MRTKADHYTVQPSDTLGLIAQRYGVSIEQLVEANSLANPDILPVGVVLTIPAPNPGSMGPDFKVLPDSELVYGPETTTFDIAGFIQSQGGYLAHYQEEVDKRALNGAQVVQRVAQDYSVNPRLLLAALEYQGGWVTNPNPKKAAVDYPMGLRDKKKLGLYHQLAWAANALNRGYYLWRVNGVSSWLLCRSRRPSTLARLASSSCLHCFMTSRNGPKRFRKRECLPRITPYSVIHSTTRSSPCYRRA
jgi:LysM repeat protein